MKTPTVVNLGVLEMFNELPCYVLNDGQRVVRLSNLTKVLRDKEHGKFGNYLAASNVVKYLPERLRPLTDGSHDRVPTQQIWKIVGMTQTCEDINESKKLASKKFKKEIYI
jgi:hypothetical protein